MSAREWVPGDVAMWKYGKQEPMRALSVERCQHTHHAIGPHWHLVNGGWTAGDPTTIRRLVVLDPEDHSTFRSALEAWTRHAFGYTATTGDCDNFAAALRSLIEPPRPPEPMGLGAVVEDDHGQRWLAVGASGGGEFRWARDGLVTGKWREYAAINVVRILSEGVTA